RMLVRHIDAAGGRADHRRRRIAGAPHERGHGPAAGGPHGVPGGRRTDDASPAGHLHGEQPRRRRRISRSRRLSADDDRDGRALLGYGRRGARPPALASDADLGVVAAWPAYFNRRWRDAWSAARLTARSSPQRGEDDPLRRKEHLHFRDWPV